MEVQLEDAKNTARRGHALPIAARRQPALDPRLNLTMIQITRLPAREGGDTALAQTGGAHPPVAGGTALALMRLEIGRPARRSLANTARVQNRRVLDLYRHAHLDRDRDKNTVPIRSA